MTPDGPGEGAFAMTSPSTDAQSASSVPPGDIGPYVLRSWVDSVPLSQDGSQDDIKINCVEYYDGNLYVGTSASELLHFVSIPPDPSDKSGSPVFIPASRLTPDFSENTSSRPGVQQILLLPRVSRACILCNFTVTFYSLPELTPYGSQQVGNCNWIGGVDLNEPAVEDGMSELGLGVTTLLSLNRRIRVVRIEDQARVVKNIDIAGSTLSVRRDSIACVADSKTYSLVDVDRILKIPLMSISSLDGDQSSGQIGQAQSIPTDTGGGIARSASSGQNRPHSSAQGHSRSISLGGSFLGSSHPQDAGTGTGTPTLRTPSPSILSSSPQASNEIEQPLQPTAENAAPVAPRSQSVPVFLKPHIASPTAEEFLLVMGTTPMDPGVGMFINLDGDPTRPTITFDKYPKEIVVDGNSSSLSSPSDQEDGYVLASMTKEIEGIARNGIEIQKWDAGSEAHPEKFWLEAQGVESPGVYGIRTLTSSQDMQFEQVVDRLSMFKFIPFPSPTEEAEAPTATLHKSASRTSLSIERLSKEKELFDRDYDSQDGEPLPEGWESTRQAEGEEFARRLARSQTKLAVWTGDRIWWAVRNPLIIQLDTQLEAACPVGCTEFEKIHKRGIIMVLSSIRGRDPKTELEFTTFGYLQQKAGLLLLINLLLSPPDRQFSKEEFTSLEEVLVESKLDPRVVLSLIPGLRNEIIEGRRGIWVYGGVKAAPEAFLRSGAFQIIIERGISGVDQNTLHFLRRYLQAWRRIKGFGSVSVEIEVFRTVDAALLLVLLELDKHSPKGLGKPGSLRAELYDLVGDKIDCFDRAIGLLQAYRRFFVLSRLYQSRKMAADVLATWKRVVEGEEDDGDELPDGEQRVRDYLTKIHNASIVQEYGLWLANRNPRLGVQVFAEDRSKAPKFEPTRVVELLKQEAPGAVKYYLEHLVFDKAVDDYVNELIKYYLDIVLDDLENPESKERVLAAYDAYRALEAPKPTYRHFLTENSPENDEAWQSRLRLLQLLGDSHDYDVEAIRQRMDSLQDDLLVPESIILDSRQRKHEDALRLLVHKLGDYDTAVSYCLRGGASIYSPNSSRRDSVPEVEQQRRLFQFVLREFLSIEDVSDRVAQTGSLLDRFSVWFEVDDVLRLIPDSWSLDIVAGFLVGALRRLVQERHESTMIKALSGAENLGVSYELVVKVEEKGPSIEGA